MILQEGYIATDQNLGTVAITILPGAMQVDIILRLNREDFLKGLSPINCLNLEDIYLPTYVLAGNQTLQSALGYEATNFIDTADITMV